MNTKVLDKLAKVRQAIYRGHPDEALAHLAEAEADLKNDTQTIRQVQELASAINYVIEKPQNTDDQVSIEQIIGDAYNVNPKHGAS